MLSGIGPRELLESLHIPVVSDLLVGYNLQDHVAFPVHLVLKHNESVAPTALDILTDARTYTSFLVDRAGPLTTPAGLETLFFSELPDTPFYSPDWPPRALRPLLRRAAWTATVLPLRPRSRGRVWLRSADPRAPPCVDPRGLAHPRDRHEMLAAVKELLTLLETGTMWELGATLYRRRYPGCERYPFASDDYWLCSMRGYASAAAHPVGTAKMGPADDPSAVVSSGDLRVRGVAGLRVADASVIPALVSGHTLMATYAVAEKAADLVKAHYDELAYIRDEDTCDDVKPTLAAEKPSHHHSEKPSHSHHHKKKKPIHGYHQETTEPNHVNHETEKPPLSHPPVTKKPSHFDHHVTKKPLHIYVTEEPSYVDHDDIVEPSHVDQHVMQKPPSFDHHVKKPAFNHHYETNKPSHVHTHGTKKPSHIHHHVTVKPSHDNHHVSRKPSHNTPHESEQPLYDNSHDTVKETVHHHLPEVSPEIPQHETEKPSHVHHHEKPTHFQHHTTKKPSHVSHHVTDKPSHVHHPESEKPLHTHDHSEKPSHEHLSEPEQLSPVELQDIQETTNVPHQVTKRPSSEDPHEHIHHHETDQSKPPHHTKKPSPPHQYEVTEPSYDYLYDEVKPSHSDDLKPSHHHKVPKPTTSNHKKVVKPSHSHHPKPSHDSHPDTVSHLTSEIKPSFTETPDYQAAIKPMKNDYVKLVRPTNSQPAQNYYEDVVVPAYSDYIDEARPSPNENLELPPTHTDESAHSLHQEVVKPSHGEYFEIVETRGDNTQIEESLPAELEEAKDVYAENEQL
ncbi:Glucose dehydrogenase [FAD, quinone] [Gryllus bimaculatus]|nr:Glucose dehydrogenase [FAD, quinone] [Gryllus bimaculatus]